MSKKDISKILTAGSPKQRLLLIAEDIARAKYSKDRILTDHEFNQISNSFKTTSEIKLWNKWKKADENITNALSNLQAIKFEVLMQYSNLRGYILVLNTIENAEVLVNSVLHEIKDIKERKRISEKGAKGIDLLFSKTIIDPEGYVDIQTDFEKDSYKDENGERIGYKDKPRKTKEYTLLHIMNNVRNDVINTATKYISWSKAIEDFMDKQGFNIKMYKDIIKNMDAEIYQRIIGWSKYREDEVNFIPDLPHHRVDKIKAKFKYNVAPNIFPIEVDPEIYNWVTKEILRDE